MCARYVSQPRWRREREEAALRDGRTDGGGERESGVADEGAQAVCADEGKTFVRSSEAGGAAYELKAAPPPEQRAGSRRVHHRGSGRRAIDEFLEEIKSRETLRGVGAQVDGDPTPSEIVYPPIIEDTQNYESTNLYIGNLAVTVTEEKLRRVFGVYGQIYSIKIMWPRSEDERRRGRNKGFVSFVRSRRRVCARKTAAADAQGRRRGRAQRHGRSAHRRHPRHGAYLS